MHEISTIVANFHDTDVRQINTGQLMFHVIAVANNNDLRVPAEMAMLAKTLLNLDGITKKLDPNFDPQAAIRAYAERLMTQKLAQKYQLILDLPHRLREILDLTATSRLTFGIKLTQAEIFLSGIHKVANRITVGVVIAALLLSSSLIMRYPGKEGFAMIGYIIAAIAAVYLIVSTLVKDHRDEERAKLKGK